MESLTHSFSFADIVMDRDPYVRMTSDNLLYVSDLAMVVTGKSNDDAGKCIRSLPESLFDPSKYVERKLSTRGGRPTKLVTLQDAIELVMVLPGKVARETRQKFAEIIRRYLAGDASLITEIQANAASDAALPKLARSPVDRLHKKLHIDFVDPPEVLPDGVKRARRSVSPAPQVTVVMDEAFQQRALDLERQVRELQQRLQDSERRVAVLSTERACLKEDLKARDEALALLEAKNGALLAAKDETIAITQARLSDAEARLCQAEGLASAATDLAKANAVLAIEKTYLTAAVAERDAKYAEMHKQMTEKYNDLFNANYDNVANLEYHIQTLQAAVPAKRGRPPKI